ncbi:MAG: helix-turn-helix domain-containing protein [Nanoarchaeota archaeon]|nr:helix-turn-helix domain-containing protein [Nanoarchaeota archaeon]MBU4300843.1 helix-turn-helix domain-containing protein [Nanoarchaeota archaeon]MBU4452185.1 helix-turn-helix domain-containing protein [Nanoarchaeota archaeon]MCG2724475.1 helix-turn-helix domain-containing protein [archaeon]
MFEARFKLKHNGCWTGGLVKFKSEFLTHITVSLTKDFVQDITEISLAKGEADAIKKYFDKSQIIAKWNVLEEIEKKLIVQVFTDTSGIKFKSVVHTILKNNCFASRKVFLKGGWEIWTIAAPEKGAIKNAIEAIKKLGALELLYVKKSTFDGFNLSDQQEMVLKYAVARGYYNWPRKISAQDLAKKLGFNKATLLEHLRKAEIKIMNREFGI